MKQTVIILISLIIWSFSATQADNEAAIDSLTPLLESHTTEDIQRVIYLNQLAKVHAHIDIEQTYHYAKEALDLSTTLEYPEGAGLANKSLGNFYFMNDRYVQALDHYLVAKLLFIEVGNEHDQAVVTNNTGLIQRRQGNYDEAINAYRDALELYLTTGNIDYQASSLLGIGVAFRYKEEFDSALVYYRESLALSEQTNNLRAISKAQNNIGLVFSEFEQYDSAMVYIESSMEIKQELGQDRLIAAAFNTLGRIYLTINDLGKAEKFCDSALVYAQKVNSLDLMVKIYEKQGEIYAGLQQYEDAYSAIQQNVALKDSIFSSDKSRAIGKLEAGYEMEKNILEEEQRREALQNAKNRRALLQYSGIFIIVLIIFFALFMLGNFSIPISIANRSIILSTLLLFEFMLLLTDPLLGSLLKGEPALVLAVNFVFAIVFIPVEELLRKALEKKLIKKK